MSGLVVSQPYTNFPGYDTNYFFVNNPLYRYSISARQISRPIPIAQPTFTSKRTHLALYKESNLLPTPAVKFILMLRMYWSNDGRPSILYGSWTIPPVKRVSA
jgi:hypothetical protein